MKSGASDPLITKKNRKEGGGFVPASTIFSVHSIWCLWVGKMHHFWWWTVGEVNWLCRQAGQANNHSIYIDVYGSNPYFKSKGELDGGEGQGNGQHTDRRTRTMQVCVPLKSTVFSVKMLFENKQREARFYVKTFKRDGAEQKIEAKITT